MAQAQWEAANAVTSDEHWIVDKQKMERMFSSRPRPWQSDPHYFKQVRMSALAALKVLMHAKTGKGKQGRTGTGNAQEDRQNWIEVMGLLQGHFTDNTLIITDSFALPVDASEVECSLNDHSVAYMIQYLERSRELGKPDAGCVGWYHSHPGYSCFLSGIDVNTQQLNQAHQDPWVALVVDPVQSVASGKLEIRAFRTLPESASPSAGSSSSRTTGMDTSSIPADKVQELGVHFHKYYELPIRLFRSKNDATQLDSLWSKYWVNVLAASPLAGRHVHLFTAKQISSLATKMKRDDNSRISGTAAVAGSSGGVIGRNDDSHLLPLWVQNANAVGSEHLQSLFMESVKSRLFGADKTDII